MKRLRFPYIRLLLLLPALLADARLVAQVKETVCFETNYGEGKALFAKGERFQHMNSISEAENSYNAAFDRFIAALGCLDIPENNDLAEWISKTKRAREQLLEFVLLQAQQAARAQRQAAQEAQMALDSLRKVQAKNDKIVAASFFYASRFALAFDGRRYGYIDRQGDPSIAFQYGFAGPFDPATGFARVTRDGNRFLLDTLGREYRLAEAVDQIDARTQAVDLRGKNLAFVPDELFQCKDSLRILFLDNNRLTRLPEAMGDLRQLSWLDVRNNPLVGLPPTLRSLPQLKHLEPADIPLNDAYLKTQPDTTGAVSGAVQVNVYEDDAVAGTSRIIQPGRGSISYVDINSQLRIEITAQELFDQMTRSNESLPVVGRFRDLQAHTLAVFELQDALLSVLDSLLTRSGPAQDISRWWPVVVHQIRADTMLRGYFNTLNAAFNDTLRSDGAVMDRTLYILANSLRDFRFIAQDRQELLQASTTEITGSAYLDRSGRSQSPAQLTDTSGAPLESVRLLLLPQRDKAALARYENLATAIGEKAARVQTALQGLVAVWGQPATASSAADLLGYLSELIRYAGDYARPFFTLDQAPRFFLDLKRVEDRNRLDRVVIRIAVRSGSRSLPAAERRVTLTKLWPHQVNKAFISLVNPYSLDSPDKPNFRFAPAFAILLKIDSRGSYFYNNYLSPGLGLGAIIPDINLDGVAEFGVGLVGTLFRDVVSFGWGWNFGVSRPYYFVGFTYPTNPNN